MSSAGCLNKNATRVPVPSGFNDLSSTRIFRDHVGWLWYQTTFFIDPSWISGCQSSKRVVLRFGSVNYFAVVWINQINVMNHTGGHLPFETEICKSLRHNVYQSITVAVNNTLSHSTIPQAEFEYTTGDDFPPGYFTQSVGFDFFNYASILRPIILYTTPATFVQDITVTTQINGYDVLVEGWKATFTISTAVLDADGKQHGVHVEGPYGTHVLPNAHFWWPVGQNLSFGYLYTLAVNVFSNQKDLLDVYCMQFGIRSVEVRKNGFFINGKRFYFKGCGMHEDFHIIGRGYNEAVMIKDLNLLHWLGANAYRTSHYPYSEERLFESDRRGLVVIGETSAVGLRVYNDDVMQLHSSVIREMIMRDKNHPCIVMWSVANEPWGTGTATVRRYFKTIVSVARKLDPSRPLTIVYGVYEPSKDATADMFDVISLNRYYAWYTFNGHTEIIIDQLRANILRWFNAHHKPILITEYGADTISGLHQLPASTFTEDYQLEFASKYHATFDSFQNGSILIGEMFWNFADFATDQGTTRVFGNRKGIFSRERQPKMAAYLMKYRYENMNRGIRMIFLAPKPT